MIDPVLGALLVVLIARVTGRPAVRSSADHRIRTAARVG
jgi:hypothetical protein